MTSFFLPLPLVDQDNGIAKVTIESEERGREISSVDVPADFDLLLEPLISNVQDANQEDPSNHLSMPLPNCPSELIGKLVHNQEDH